MREREAPRVEIDPTYRDPATSTRVLEVRGAVSRPLVAVAVALGMVLVLAVTRAATSTHPTLALLVFGLPSALAFVLATGRLGLQLATRTRFEIDARGITARSGGRTVFVEPWAARNVRVRARSSSFWKPLHVETFELLVEDASGHEVVLATLGDTVSLDRALAALGEAGRDAGEDTTERHPFAVVHGPLPPGVSCEGDPRRTDRAWRITIRCSDRDVVLPEAAFVGLAVIELFCTIAALGVLFSDTRHGASPLVLIACVAAIVAWSARALWRQEIVLRRRGVLHLEMDHGLSCRTTPDGLEPPLRFDGAPVRLEVHHDPRSDRDAVVFVRQGDRRARLPGPITPAAALYLARLVAAHQGLDVETNAEAS